MKSYTITVNGNVYDVTVEEKASVAGTAANTVNNVTRVASPVIKSEVSPKIKASSEAAGSVLVKASVPGKVFKVEVSPGQSVKKGENLLILEAMKMEIPVVAPEAGVVADIQVAVGDTVETGDLLASLK